MVCPKLLRKLLHLVLWNSLNQWFPTRGVYTQLGVYTQQGGVHPTRGVYTQLGVYTQKGCNLTYMGGIGAD